MSNYYYLASSLPSLEFPVLPEQDVESLSSSLEENLSKEDSKKLESLRLLVDILNLKPLLQEEEIDPRGNLGEKQLGDALLSHDCLPDYVFEFLDEQETLVDKLKNFSFLLARFFKEEIAKQKGFLLKFFTFEREWRLVVLALRAKVLGRDIFKELQFEDPQDPFVMQILAQKDAEVYEPPVEYKELKDLFSPSEAGQKMNSWEQNKALALFRFRKVEEMKEREQFSVDFILAYLVQAMIIEYWNELDLAKGKIILDTFKKS